MSHSREEAIEMVVAVLEDSTRSRCLVRSEDGVYDVLNDPPTYPAIDARGPGDPLVATSPPCIRIGYYSPADLGDETRLIAEGYLDMLDAEIAEAMDRCLTSPN